MVDDHIGVVDRLFLCPAGFTDDIGLFLKPLFLTFANRIVGLLLEHIGLDFGGIGDVVAKRIVALSAARREREQAASQKRVEPDLHVSSFSFGFGEGRRAFRGSIPVGPYRFRYARAVRSEARRVGKEGVSTCRSRWSP